MKNKTTAIFSGPLFKQTCRANVVLAVAILIIMIMMANVTNYAMSIMATDTKDGIGDNTQEDLFSYMFVMASYNEIAAADLSYEDFVSDSDRGDYEKAFDWSMKAARQGDYKGRYNVAYCYNGETTKVKTSPSLQVRATTPTIAL